MLIRSQDKKSITTDLNLEIYENEAKNEHVIGNITRGGLGTYSTEQKAIKVLDMIQKTYCDCITAQGQSFYFAIDHPKVFQMPQDEEVEA